MGLSISPYQNPSVSAIGASPPELLRRQMPTVDFSPAEIVRHQTAHWRGVQVETVQIISHEHFEYSFKQQRHLLIAVEQGVRYDGETLVEGLPASTVHNYSHKLILVPAGRRLFGTQNPRLLTRSICLYIDPQTVPVDPDLGFAEADLQPRLLFEDSSLWQTVLKQQRRVIDFMEEHLAEAISLNVLADLVRLSPYHFLRSFKQSFGEPPHRYYTVRRIERAKALLANPRASITGIAIDAGFGGTSAFSATFHRITGQTPSDYRRSLE